MKLCRDCEHCKTVKVGYVSYRSWCKCLPKNKRGIRIDFDVVNPKCPLKENRNKEGEYKG